MKVVVNRCYGGFGLSHKATLRYLELKGFTPYWQVSEISRKYYDNNPESPSALVHYGTQPDFMSQEVGGDDSGYFDPREIPRNDPMLIQVVTELGEAANGRCAKLVIVEIPDGIDWEIEEYDGQEWISEKHRRW